MSRNDVERTFLIAARRRRNWGDSSRSPANVCRLGWHSFLREPGLAQAIEKGRNVWRNGLQPLDGEFGIEAAGLRQGCLLLVHLAFDRIDRGQITVDEERTIARVGCVVVFAHRRVEMPEAKFHIAQMYMEQTD